MDHIAATCAMHDVKSRFDVPHECDDISKQQCAVFR